MNTKQRHLAASRLGNTQTKVERTEKALERAKEERRRELLASDGVLTRENQAAITGKSVGWVQEQIKEARTIAFSKGKSNGKRK